MVMVPIVAPDFKIMAPSLASESYTLGIHGLISKDVRCLRHFVIIHRLQQFARLSQFLDLAIF